MWYYLGRDACRSEGFDLKALETRIKNRVGSTILPWNCSLQDDRQVVRFGVLSPADLFLCLLRPLLEWGAPSRELDVSQTHREISTYGSVSAWDGEQETGIRVDMDGGQRVQIFLPWVNATHPVVEVTSGRDGFTEDEAYVIARLIKNGNTPAPPPNLFRNGLLGMMLQPPQREMLSPGSTGSPFPDGPQARREGESSQLVSQLQSLGCTVHNAPDAASEGRDELSWSHLAGVDKIRREVCRA